MEPLAILCERHADGAVSLRLLRNARVATVGALAASEPAHVASLLGLSLDRAQRMVRDARRLAERALEVPAAPPFAELLAFDAGA